MKSPSKPDFSDAEIEQRAITALKRAFVTTAKFHVDKSPAKRKKKNGGSPAKKSRRPQSI